MSRLPPVPGKIAKVLHSTYQSTNSIIKLTYLLSWQQQQQQVLSTSTTRTRTRTHIRTRTRTRTRIRTRIRIRIRTDTTMIVACRTLPATVVTSKYSLVERVLKYAELAQLSDHGVYHSMWPRYYATLSVQVCLYISALYCS